jgi:hypothetical protein
MAPVPQLLATLLLLQAPPEDSGAEQEQTPPPRTWTATAGLGLIVLAGNASNITFNGLAAAERKTTQWIYSFRAAGTYGRSRPPEVEGQPAEPARTIALNANLQLRGDRRFTERFSGYLLTSAETDRVRSVELRSSGEGGASAIWWERTTEEGLQSFLRTDLAFRIARERRFQYYPTRENLPDVSIGGPRIGLNIRYAISRDTLLHNELSVLASAVEGARLIVNNQAKLTVRLTRALGLGTALLFQYDSEPPEGKLPVDASFTMTFEVAL